jgi:type IV pilus assembly protein PilC
MSAGVNVVDALNVTSKALGNAVIEDELIEASKAVINGQQLSVPLSASKVFPPIVSQMMAIGEETGQTDEILVKVADFYEEEVDAVVESLSSILEPIMIVVMGTMVGLIAASVMGPITKLSSQI